MVAGTDLSDLRKLTVVKLRDRLAKLGLSTSGLKADLVERLFKHYKEEDENEDEAGRDNMDTNIPPPVEAPRTALQLRLQQMAGQPNKDGSTGPGPAPPPPSTSKPAPSMTRSQPPPSTRSQPPPSTRSQPPPSLLSQPVQPPRSQMVQQPAAGGPPSLLSGPQIRPPGPPGPPPGMQSQPPPRPPNSQPMGQSSQQYGGPPPQQMSQSNPPRGVAPQMVQPTPARQQIPPPPPHMMLPPPVQEPDLQEKIAMQTRMLEQERKQQQEQQRMQEQQRIAEQQQKERLAIQQQAMLLQQQKNESEDSNTGLMEKVRQQQMMLEQQKQKERLEQQQQAMMEQQNQAIKKQEEERRQKEAELLRQQQIALMEAQRDKQEKQMREERAPPRPQRPPIEPLMSQNAPFNPRPGMLNMPHGGPREMMPPTTSSMSYVPPHSSSGRIPPLLPPDSNEPIRPPRRGTPPDERPEKQEPKEMKLAPALEKVLAFKDVRAQEVGLTPEEIEKLNMPEEKPVEDEHEIEMVEMEEEDNEEEELEEEVVQTESKKESKNKRRKKKKKKTKKVRTMEPTKRRLIIPLDKKDEVQIEYVQEQLDLDPSDPNYFTFSKIFEMFKISEEPVEVPKVEEPVPVKPAEPKPKGQFDSSSDEDGEDADEKQDDRPKLSKKKLKKLTRLSVAQLKQLVARPDVVEMHDVTAQDPRLCVHLKATRNTVPVPRHWCFKRKYLQGKRGIEKPPFELPDYIQATGITEMRAALAEKEDQKNLKAKMREKVRPKMGKIDIDYQKLHDAFFRWQTKPKMTIHGDLYYEGKEFETRLKEKKPGNITDDLKTALGMPIGHGSEKVPPPWLIAMQRYGPPPSYPNLKIPGLNAPIPETCTFGYHAGGWGKPPVDENGKPLYGDVFGTKGTDFETVVQEDDIDQSHWGELESESESEEESSEEEEEEGPEESGLMTPAEGLVTPSGITSIPVGMETPDMIELRKRRIEDAMDQGGETPALYQVLPEKKSGVGAAMMGSAHIYDVPGLAAKKPGEKGAMEGVEIALNPEELDLDTAAMQAKYDQTIREQQSQLEKEDLSDMVAEHAAKQKKRKKKQDDSGKAAKKYKEFKF